MEVASVPVFMSGCFYINTYVFTVLNYISGSDVAHTLNPLNNKLLFLFTIETSCVSNTPHTMNRVRYKTEMYCLIRYE
jgi:hypothetical protein